MFLSERLLSKKITKSVFVSLLSVSSLYATQNTFAEAPGGPDCGWGNMLFQGDKGPIPHTAAYMTNGLTSFNAFFGIVAGTNGCETDGKLTYGGTPRIGLNHIMDELAEDVAVGSGEALSALSVALKIEKQDRTYFETILHQNFESIFPNDKVQAKDVMARIGEIINDDTRLKHYLS